MFSGQSASATPPPTQPNSRSSIQSGHSGGSSVSSSISLQAAFSPSAERTLSAALRGDYIGGPVSQEPKMSISSGNARDMAVHLNMLDHISERMSVDDVQNLISGAGRMSIDNATLGDASTSQQQQQNQAGSSRQPGHDYQRQIQAQIQAQQAQQALRLAEQAARVAEINAASAQKALEQQNQQQMLQQNGNGDTSAGDASASDQQLSSGAQTPSSISATPAIRKTAGKYALTDFRVERTLGTGSFGRVHLVKSKHNLRYYAVKVLGKDKVVRMKQVEHTNSERAMLVRVRHPFLVNLWGTFQDGKNLFMVMDFVAGGELFSLLRKSQRFPNSVAKFYAAEVALALDYLHSLDIIYRDLKPENILLGADGHVKVTDFGFAKYVPDITWTLCGTPDYLAPEVVQSKGYNKSVDWYALGVLVFEMLAGYPPFFTEDGNPMRLYEKIIAGKVRYPSYFDDLSKDLLKNLLTSDLTKRFGNLLSGSHDIFTHQWFAEVDWDRLYRRDIPAPYVPKIEGDGDSSQFDRYTEADISEYGQLGEDAHGHLFPDF